MPLLGSVEHIKTNSEQMPKFEIVSSYAWPCVKLQRDQTKCIGSTPLPLRDMEIFLPASPLRGQVIDHLDGHVDIVHKLLQSSWQPWGLTPRDLVLHRYWRKEDESSNFNCEVAEGSVV
ncbi:hypothetical protein SUGI_1047540 [Cryptomeria japonica]|nr:hypothetical protein SUGI_1047540 [Cryptomeria japonica]